jgi:chemotaxis protein MotA
MNIGAGWMIALGCVIAGFMWLGGHLEQLWVPQEYLIIFGAAMGTLVASNKWRNLKSMFRAFVRIFLPSHGGRAANLGLLCLMFELLQRIKRDGALSIESDIADPKQSELFAKYPTVLKSPRLIEFITDYFTMMMDGTVTLGQLESVMAQEIEVMNQEALEPSESISTLADSMPAFGIVAAIIGVVHALSSIKTGIGPGEIGDMISQALVGTLLGVFAAYAMMLPVSRSMEQLASADVKPYEAVKEILIANYSNFSPMIAVEYGRKVMFTDQRPTMKELSEGVMATSGNKLTG